ncbi:spermatogenesis-associated protein 16 [Balearica regulorum gibbericeps]|uniref:spermatogenesis-associated protein 16 n=1 Tax=Balearica regulorum gibbericeps TaxID=100784 RepID=UPI003F5F54E2
MDGKNETSQQMRRSEESNVAASKLNDIPEALQEVKNHSRDRAEENTMRTIKMAEEMKEKQSNNVGRANHKRKSENNEKTAVKKEETTLETGNQLIPTPLSHIPLKSLMDIEAELVYADEDDIYFEFTEPLVSTSTQSACRDSGKADALSTPNGSALRQIDKQLQMTLRETSACYRQKNYTAATEQLSKALELCSKGAALDNPFKSSPEDVSSIASFIETKLVTCYLKLKKPDDALNHAHRSIILNPAYFRNHLRQAAAFRCLERYSEAARSAMIADYMYWLTGGTEQHISKLIKLYWQTMIEGAITTEESFSVMYTPFVTEVKADKINKIKDLFAEKHPDYTEHIYTDPHGVHILPQTADWPSLPPQQYLLTLGFRNKHIGKTLERWSRRKLPIFSDQKAPFSPLTTEETKRYWDNTGKKIIPVMNFIRSTKLTDNLCACSRGIEKLHYASLLGRLQRVEEQSQVINQAMAELATVPYLQDISQQDAKLLQSLMADAMDTLEGRNSDNGRVWNEIQKIGLIEDYLYQAEDNYLKNKRLRKARTEKRKMKRIQSTQQQ